MASPSACKALFKIGGVIWFDGQAQSRLDLRREPLFEL
jgi:hypothetical protein